MTKSKCLYNVRRSSYEREWGEQYEKPGPFSRFFALLFRIFPKVGPFKSIAFRVPTQQTEKLFMQSFNQTLDLYRSLLREYHNGTPTLENRDFDTGKPSIPGEYRLADETFARLTRDLAKKNFSTLTPELYAALIEFYRNPEGLRRAAAKAAKKDQQAWRDTQAAVAQLQALNPPRAHPAPEGH